MALILSVATGDDFYVNGTRVYVAKAQSPSHVVLICGDREFYIADDKMIEIMPDVLISVGNGAHMGVVRIAIEAPKSVKIATGRNYRKCGHNVS